MRRGGIGLPAVFAAFCRPAGVRCERAGPIDKRCQSRQKTTLVKRVNRFLFVRLDFPLQAFPGTIFSEVLAMNHDNQKNVRFSTTQQGRTAARTAGSSPIMRELTDDQFASVVAGAFYPPLPEPSPGLHKLIGG